VESVVKRLGEASIIDTGTNVLWKRIMENEYLCEVREKFGGKFYNCDLPAVARTTKLIPMYVCKQHEIIALIAGAKPKRLEEEEPMPPTIDELLGVLGENFRGLYTGRLFEEDGFTLKEAIHYSVTFLFNGEYCESPWALTPHEAFAFAVDKKLKTTQERCDCGRELFIKKICNVCDRDE
jgi:hypothetical protein